MIPLSKDKLTVWDTMRKYSEDDVLSAVQGLKSSFSLMHTNDLVDADVRHAFRNAETMVDVWFPCFLTEEEK